MIRNPKGDSDERGLRSGFGTVHILSFNFSAILSRKRVSKLSSPQMESWEETDETMMVLSVDDKSLRRSLASTKSKCS
jgi:hypothetical protein